MSESIGILKRKVAAWKLLAEGRSDLLAAYRTGANHNAERGLRKVDKARERLAKLGEITL